jgi:sec-independent protein translocase protein TatC
MQQENGEEMLSFGGHLEVLRRMLLRVGAVAMLFAVVIFCCKELTFKLLLAPSEWNFVTYRWIEQLFGAIGYDFHFNEFHVDLIATDLSSQFMTHLSTSLYLGLLFSSPFALYELFRFVSPALYESERRYSVPLVIVVYVLFIAGILMSYFVLFPVAFRFLGTYSVASQVRSMITLDSYISTFTTLTLVMGLVFQLPVIAFVLAKMGMVNASLMAHYRKHALIVIMLVAAIITPPDIMTLLLVTLPLYLLYEVSILVIRRVAAN